MKSFQHIQHRGAKSSRLVFRASAGEANGGESKDSLKDSPEKIRERRKAYGELKANAKELSSFQITPFHETIFLGVSAFSSIDQNKLEDYKVFWNQQAFNEGCDRLATQWQESANKLQDDIEKKDWNMVVRGNQILIEGFKNHGGIVELHAGDYDKKARAEAAQLTRPVFEQASHLHVLQSLPSVAVRNEIENAGFTNADSLAYAHRVAASHPGNAAVKNAVDDSVRQLSAKAASDVNPLERQVILARLYNVVLRAAPGKTVIQPEKIEARAAVWATLGKIINGLRSHVKEERYMGLKLYYESLTDTERSQQSYDLVGAVIKDVQGVADDAGWSVDWQVALKDLPANERGKILKIINRLGGADDDGDSANERLVALK